MNWILLLALLGAHTAAVAQDYPAKPIRLIIPFPAGSSDVHGRTFAQRAALGQPVVVENVPGANGAIGLTRTAKSAPDGYTLSMAATSTFAVSPHINLKLSYDPLKDFVPIAMHARTTSVLVVNGNVPARSVGELVALAKASPGKFNYASIGTGSTNHLLGELFRRAAGIDIVHVPYKGKAPGLTALLAGEVQFFFFPAFTDSMPRLCSGRLRGGRFAPLGGREGYSHAHRTRIRPGGAGVVRHGRACRHAGCDRAAARRGSAARQ